MESTIGTITNKSTRIGFHYFPDTTHYSDKELGFWMPELKSLHCAWIVLKSDLERAIPENFIRSLIQMDITPIVQVNMDLHHQISSEDLRPIFNAYSHWGVKHLQCFDRPNDLSSWSSSSWAQQDLVDRFLDIYIPYALMTLDYGMIPVFPALKPGGSFWDTAFLRAALESLDRRKQTTILSKLTLSAYACTQGHTLDWGAGGPEKWPDAHPYLTPGNSEDHRGFHIADWYLSISRSVLNRELPIMLLNAGQIIPPGEVRSTPPSSESYSQVCVQITDLLLKNPNNRGEPNNFIPANVIACNFSPLVMDDEDQSKVGWYESNGTRLPIVSEFLDLFPGVEQKTFDEQLPSSERDPSPDISSNLENSYHPIEHYLLLPTYEWGVADWHLDVIRPFVKKYKPAIGFSLEEALMAKQVTVIGNSQVFPEEELDALRQSGCQVERISGDGTSIATTLSER